MSAQYYELALQSIKQFDAEVFFGSISFRDLQQSSKLTSRKDGNGFYQRPTKDYAKIKEFIFNRRTSNTKRNLPIFPTPLILGVSIDDEIEIQTESDIEKYFLDDLEDAKAIFWNGKLYIPKKGIEHKKNVILIVDGQHRFRGVDEYLKEQGIFTEDFTFLATFMIGSDLYEQSIVFADVNFNQRPVNKSLMYDILGVLPDAKDKHVFSHYLVKSINESPELAGLIKMLGNGNGIISLAFMVEIICDKLLDLNNKNESRGKGNLHKYYMQYVDENGSDYKKLPNIFIDYFTFIKNNFEKYFPLPKADGTYSVYGYKSVLFKTTGIYAWLMLLNDIFPSIDVAIYNKDNFYKQLEKMLVEIIAQQDNFFGENSRFSKGGGASLQKLLYDGLKELAKI